MKQTVQLARDVCRAVQQTVAHKSSMYWVGVNTIAKMLKIRDLEDMRIAIAYAESEDWLTAGGRPVHSLCITKDGARMLKEEK
jgi:hypothetical protein